MLFPDAASFDPPASGNIGDCSVARRLPPGVDERTASESGEMQAAGVSDMA